MKSNLNNSPYLGKINTQYKNNKKLKNNSFSLIKNTLLRYNFENCQKVKYSTAEWR